MALLMDGMLMAATLFAGGYCWVLARRVSDLKDLDKGLGGAIVTLTRQIEMARTTLEEARSAATDTRQDLGQLSARAETAAGQLRLLLATVKEPEAPPAPTPARMVAPAKPQAAPEIPKPRSMPGDGMLRGARAGTPRGESDILDALSAMAGGARG